MSLGFKRLIRHVPPASVQRVSVKHVKVIENLKTIRQGQYLEFKPQRQCGVKNESNFVFTPPFVLECRLTSPFRSPALCAVILAPEPCCYCDVAFEILGCFGILN